VTILNRIATLALGATAMYYFDPQSGRRRRARLCDQLTSLRNDAMDCLLADGKRAADHVRGYTAAARRGMGLSDPDSDRQLEERVRAQLGRLVSHPGAITVTAHTGDVTLSGQILAAEHQTLLSAVRAMAGVNRVDDRLQAHETPGNIPELQGGSPS